MLKDDSIQLHEHQIKIIKKHAMSKSEWEWISSARGIKIPLTAQQKITLVSLKDQVFQLLSPSKDPKEILLQRRGFGFANHAFERILERVERLSEEEVKALGVTNYQYAVYPETLENVVGSLIDSQKVKSFAVWKGYPYLNYSFLCNLDDRELDIVVNFELGILIVTLVINKETGYFVREVYKIEVGKPIKKPSPY
jgi:hypothetical protein